jgi:hypothetical protein
MDKKLKNLYKIWNKKLEKSGFVDIENGNKLKRYDGDWFSKHINSLDFNNTKEFYTKCEKFLQVHNFQTAEHEHIFSLFCSGKTQKEIANNVTIGRTGVEYVLAKYLKKMMEEDGISKN